MCEKCRLAWAFACCLFGSYHFHVSLLIHLKCLHMFYILSDPAISVLGKYRGQCILTNTLNVLYTGNP